uniref:Nonsense-mediated mRNA decay factor SMG8 n=1 Tax=Panagrolaimus sp. ES5 TaxID=591445 RepID=A0AC34FH81_9BILA
SIERTGSYLDNYDDNLKLDKPKALSYEKLLKHFKGQFIEYLPHSNAPLGLLPGFPSWSLKAIGPSNRYSHQHGLRLPNFKHGCDFLLPLDVYLRVNSKDWENDLKKLNPRLDLSARSRRKPLGLDEEEGMNTEKVKFFVGFDYECPRGHRFFIEQPNKAVKAEKRLGPFAYKDEAKDLLESDVPIWMPCTCRRNPLVPAQLMRLHIVTPKAPVSSSLNIRVQPSSINQNGYFYPSSEPFELTYNKYYILRLPFAYEGPDGPIHPPRTAKSCGRLFKNWFTAKHQRL